MLYVDAEFELIESKEMACAKLLLHVDVELCRYLNVKKGLIDRCFMWTLNLVGT